MIIVVFSLQEIKLPQIPNLSVFDPFLCKSVEFLLIISRNNGRPISLRLEYAQLLLGSDILPYRHPPQLLLSIQRKLQR